MAGSVRKVQPKPAHTLTDRSKEGNVSASAKNRGYATRSGYTRKNQLELTLEHPAAERGGDRAPLPESQSKRRGIIELGSYQNAQC